MCRYAAAAVSRSSAATPVRRGRRSETPTDWPGLMPHVTTGSISSARSTTSSSKLASPPVAMERQYSSALPNASALGACGRPRT